MLRKFVFVAAVVFASTVVWAQNKNVAFPSDWRSWQHVKSMVIPDKAHGLYGFHHVYVQQKGLKALQAGKGYPQGTTFAVPFYEVVTEGGNMSQGPSNWMYRPV